MLAVAFALASSVAIGSTDFLAGLKSRQLGVATVLVVSQLTSLILLALVMVATGTGIPSDSEFLLLAFASGISQVIAVIAFWHGLTVGTMGVIAPITAAGGGAIPVTFGLLQGDRPGALQIGGVAVAVVGVVLASYEPLERRNGTKPLAAGVEFALIASIAIGAFYVCIAGAANEGGALSAAAANRVLSAGLMVLPAIALHRRIRAARPELPALAAVGGLEVTGIILFAAAGELGLLSIVGALGALYPLTTVVLAHVVLGERLHPAQRVGAVLALAGIVAIGSAAGS